MAATTVIRNGVIATGLLCALATVVWAHDPGLSSAQLRITGSELVAHITFARAEISPAAYVMEVRAGNVVLPAIERRVETEGQDVRFHLRYELPAGGELRVRSPAFDALPRGHRQYLTVSAAGHRRIVETLLTADAPEATIPVSDRRHASSAGKFVALGVEHILTGYDHLLFLFGLLIVGGGLRAAAKIITSFTVAHSVTLALATLNFVSLPGKIVEPLIAASIMYVGIENLFRRDLERRWMLTFGFGLVHGLGFAGALRELGIGADGAGVAVPLLSFNLGVELGQLAIAAVVLPLIWRLRRLPAVELRFAPACSLFIVLAGSFWLVQRTLLN
jgi:hydrogenase/urease accessory protein HupE